MHERIFTDTPVGRIRIDLRKVVRDRAPELLPLRRWAIGRLSEESGPHGTEVHLDISALERMAELCRMDTVDLIARLRTIGGSSIESPDPVA